MADLARRVIQVSADDVIGPTRRGNVRDEAARVGREAYELLSQDDDIVHATIWDPVSTESWLGAAAAPQLGFGHFDKIAREMKQA